MSVYVIVLGDMGHSPRMCNHALSLAEEGLSVTYVGYAGSALPLPIRQHPRIRPLPLQPYPKSLSNALPRLLNYILKALWVSLSLLLSLPLLWGPNFILLQNPPSIPSLPLLVVYTFLHPSTKLILDWHNYGWSILALSLGVRHPLVRLSKWIEKVFGARTASSFCVSRAMKEDLELNYGIPSVQVLYDRPSEAFQPISTLAKHNLFKRRPEFRDTVGLNGTLFTQESNSLPEKASLRKDRPGLLVSSTSWTEDEDFGILLEALQFYEDALASDEMRAPSLIVVITGKGPMKEKYKSIIQERAWTFVTVITPWLEPEDYPLMLASADLGVCLHTSSSGLDLPMKVVDMFGCGLPVAAVNYPTITELLRDGENGMVFETSKELGTILLKWFEGFPIQTENNYESFSSRLDDYRRLRWKEYWKVTASAVFKME